VPGAHQRYNTNHPGGKREERESGGPLARSGKRLRIHPTQVGGVNPTQMPLPGESAALAEEQLQQLQDAIHSLGLHNSVPQP